MAEYKQTLNLPKTDFPIRANLKNVEEECLLKWGRGDIYGKMQAREGTKGKFILHDGPPYPNGDIHLGHALNKILKDIIVKYKGMSGFSAPYVPGWDCHGLPIETQLIKEIGDKRKDLSITEFRNKCKEYALKYVELQKKEFIKLGVFGEWDNPYLTIDHSYEEKIVELFGILAEKGYVYRGLKPIHWCPHCETALAEAEIEYEDDRSPSIFVKFEILTPVALSSSTPLHFMERGMNSDDSRKKGVRWFFVIWTTTPWTLPANVAIAAHPEYEYVFLRIKGQGSREEVYIVAEGLMEDFVKRIGITDYTIIDKTKGKNLEGILVKHPFIDRDSMLVLDEYVTLEQGTGLVHIAPGHGEEDYKVGLKYKLPIVMPVDERGHFDQTVPDFIAGKYYDSTNKLIVERMQADGALLKLEFFKHPYPHCWRCKKPVIFRATEQWFVAVDHNNMRQEALKAIGETQWIPAWGENRIRGMIDTRPDWCISRQRSWGVPIPVFYCKRCGKPLMTGLFNQAIRELVREHGTNGWFEKEASEILPAGTNCPNCQHDQFKKESDILDVWFESGSSHAAVLENRPDHRWPADLYLEGSDQHRGWFQSSLLISVGYKGRAPYNAVLTHGFTIDDKGKKMSKSSGNVISPQEVIKEYGTDILRLWVASTDFRSDMAASKNILIQVREAYSKIRNTCRFLLSNLNDYSPNSQLQAPNLLEIDRWILLRLQRLIERCRKAYDGFEFHLVYHSLYDFCVNDLSAFYLDMSKDRLYCSGKDSVERRSAQFALSEILQALIKLMAPILAFTAEDIFKYTMTNDKCQMSNGGSVFLLDMPEVKEQFNDKKLEERWEKLMALREEVYGEIEKMRAKKEIASSTEALVEIGVGSREWVREIESLLPMILIVSQIRLMETADIIVRHADGTKCERCWLWSESVGKHADHPALCDRCHSVVTAS